MIAIGEGDEVEVAKGIEVHPGKERIVIGERFLGEGFFVVERFVESAKELSAFLVLLFEFEFEKLSLSKCHLAGVSFFFFSRYSSKGPWKK